MTNTIPELDTKGLRQFGLILAGMIAIMVGLVLPYLFKFAFTPWPWAIGAGLAIWTLLAADQIRPVYRGWMRLALLLNAIVTRLVLGIVFYLVVLPIGLIFRIRGVDPMHRALDDKAKSYRTLSTGRSRNHMEKPF